VSISVSETVTSYIVVSEELIAYIFRVLARSLFPRAGWKIEIFLLVACAGIRRLRYKAREDRVVDRK
jgi:hypothetical protein